MILHPMINRLRGQPTLGAVVATAVADVVSLLGAEYGNLQLCDRDGALLLVAQRRLPRAFLAAFRRVVPGETTVCDRAARLGRTVVVRDVERDREFAPFIAQARETRFRAVLSSPLVGPDGRVVGVISAHFANPCSPTPVEIATLEAYTPQVAQHILDKLGDEDVAQAAARLYDDMLAAAPRDALSS